MIKTSKNHQKLNQNILDIILRKRRFKCRGRKCNTFIDERELNICGYSLPFLQAERGEKCHHPEYFHYAKLKPIHDLYLNFFAGMQLLYEQRAQSLPKRMNEAEFVDMVGKDSAEMYGTEPISFKNQ
jgi:hypothetical protein